MPNNFLEMLRLKNLFNPMEMGSATNSAKPYDNISFGNDQIGVPQAAPMNAPVAPEAQYDPAARMKELYTPDMSASTRFNQMVGEQPQYEEPSGKRRVGGAILGALTDLGTNLGGNKTGVKGSSVYDDVTRKNDYRENLDDWRKNIAPAREAASLERTSNSNQRMMANSIISSETTNAQNRAKNDQNDRKITISEGRAKAYEWKTKHPGHKFDFSGPTVLSADTITGEVFDTGIATGSLSAEDQAGLNQKNALEKIHTTADEARATEGVKQTGRKELIPLRGEQSRLTKGTPSGNVSGVKGETPTNTAKRQFNAAQEFKTLHPDLAKFVKLGKGTFSITPPPNLTGNSIHDFFTSAGPTPEQHKAITAAIYGSGLQMPQPGRTGDVPTASANAPSTGSRAGGAIPSNIPPAPPGRIKVMTPDGQTGNFRGTAEEARSKGYRIIG